MKTHYSAAELAELKLPGLPGSERNTRARADRENWPFIEVDAKGGKTGKRREYAFQALPEIARLRLAELDSVEIAPAAAATPPIVYTAPPPQALKSSQLDAEIARNRLIQFIDAFDGSTPRAIDYLNAGFHAQTLEGPLMFAMNHAWSKPRATRRLTIDTLNKWKSLPKKRGRSAPLVRQKDMEIKPWYGLAIELKQRPQGSCLTWIAEQLAEAWVPAWGHPPASAHTVRRFFNEKFSQIDQLKGRLTGSALSPHKHYCSRTAAGLQPWDEVHADGWNTHFTAPHPVTGEYVTYEVWHAHDVATRFVPPFGLGLTENFEVIAKCVENAVRFGGCMALLQTDSTKIVKNGEAFKSLAERVGFTVKHPTTVGNSQANGIAENFNSWLDKECRELATYQARGMDGLTLKRVKKITARAVRAQKAGDHDGYALALNEAERMGKGRVFRSHDEACTWLEEKRQKWNDKPHRALLKIRDPQSGTLRHQSPNEALQAAREAGWAPETFTEDYLVHLFRIHKQLVVRREAISPYGGMRYHHECLGDWNGKTVAVAVDPMDWKQVWVKTLDGELICVAPFSEATGYSTLSAQEAAEQRRAEAQIKHRERQIEAIRERAKLDAIDGESSRVIDLAALDSPATPTAPAIDLVPRLSDEEFSALENAQRKPKAKTLNDLAMFLHAEAIEAGMQKDSTPEKESAAG